MTSLRGGTVLGRAKTFPISHPRTLRISLLPRKVQSITTHLLVFSLPNSANAVTPVIMLDRLETYPPFSPKAVSALDKVYSLSSTGNAEIALRFFEIALKSSADYAEKAAEWVVSKGRMKFCRPVFRLLNEQAPELAKKTFMEHAGFYHPIARKMIAKDLGLKVE